MGTVVPEIKGYKPVIHRGCGGRVAWVKVHVKAGDRMLVSDALELNGSKVLNDVHPELVCERCRKRVYGPFALAI